MGLLLPFEKDHIVERAARGIRVSMPNANMNFFKPHKQATAQDGVKTQGLCLA
jgi:hypothetical protein